MPRAAKRKRLVIESDSEDEDFNHLAARRSSLNVNLSFTSNLSDPRGSDSDHDLLRKETAGSKDTSEEENEELTRTVRKRNTKVARTKNVMSDDSATPASIANVTVVSAVDHKTCKIKSSKNSRHSVSDMEKKDQQLNKSCIELQNAIINKTKSLLDNELSKKTSEILTGCSSSITQIDDDVHENRSPSVRLNVGKNDQIVMTGCGEKQNPVQINSMSKNVFSENINNNKASQSSDHDGSDYSQSIASTPKKCNIQTSLDKSSGKILKQIIKVPVARLFADNNADNSMSETNSISTPENLRSNLSTDNETNKNSKMPRVSNDLNNTVSPILSQGIRKTRISRLSLKKKLTSNEAGSSRLSTNTTNESFINRLPITCSSFIEKTCNKSNLDQLTDTIVLEEKSESNKNQKTINLDENNTKTINIDDSSSRSSMEITTISARTPIVRKSFQKIIRKTFQFDKADFSGNKIQMCTNAIDSSVKQTHKSNTASNNVEQDNFSVNTVRTSLNVNTSLDDVSLAERVIQKENRRPSNTKEVEYQTTKNNTTRQSRTLTTMRSSLRVNTSLDSVRKSSDSSKTDCEQEKRENMQCQPTSSNNNQEVEENIERQSNRPSHGTVRSSMQVNTSLDSIQKSPNTHEPLNYNKILSMVAEASCQSPDDSETENISLVTRVQTNSVSKNKKTVNKQDNSKEVTLETSKGKNKKSNKSKTSYPTKEKSSDTEKNDLENRRKSNEIINNNLQEDDSTNSESSTRRKSSRKSKTNLSKRSSINKKNLSSTASESSIVEPTPFPASRSLLFKTIIKNNIAMNTLDPRKLIDSSDEDENDGPHLTLSKKTNSSTKKVNNVHEKTAILSDDSDNTVIVNSSDESSNESKKEKQGVLINETMNDTGNQNKSEINKSRKLKKRKLLRQDSDSSDEEKSGNLPIKRKLYPLRENSQISFSPAEVSQDSQESVPKKVERRKRKKKMTQKKQVNVETVSPEAAEISDHTENEISIEKPEKKKKKPRKIKSKKIVVKKVTNLTLLDNMLENDGSKTSSNERNSLREFDLRRAKNSARKDNHKIVIVATGLDKDGKDLVKSVVKSLGAATLQANVTPRTTHVISSGVRTINLLKAIIRGCWLLPLEWALKSLESEKWLDPLPYEMSHFAKAVQINRRDRKIFGKAYTPELFITCGPIYIENGTTPPTSALKELVKTAGGTITDDPITAKIIVGSEGLKENWILDSITTGEIQSFDQYERN